MGVLLAGAISHLETTLHARTVAHNVLMSKSRVSWLTALQDRRCQGHAFLRESSGHIRGPDRTSHRPCSILTAGLTVSVPRISSLKLAVTGGTQARLRALRGLACRAPPSGLCLSPFVPRKPQRPGPHAAPLAPPSLAVSLTPEDASHYLPGGSRLPAGICQIPPQSSFRHPNCSDEDVLPSTSLKSFCPHLT